MAENIYQTDHTQTPSVFLLIEQNKTSAVIKMLEADPSLINLKGWMDDTPLHKAAYTGNFELVCYLVESGAEINARRTDGGTSLYWTSTGEIAQYLVEKGATLDHDSHYTPLNWAVRYERPDVMEVLLKYGMDINAGEKYPILEIRDIECLSVFVKHKANLNLKDEHGRSILHWIAWYDNAPLLDYAISVGVEWSRNNAGETPYYVAQRGNRQGVINLLIQKYPQFVSEQDVEINVLNECIENIDKYIFIASNDSIISIGKNAHLSLWKITDATIVFEKSIQLNRPNIGSISYKDGEPFFIIPSEEKGVLELRDIKTLELMSKKQLAITSAITATAYSKGQSYILVSESWSPVYKLDLDFNIKSSTEIDYGISRFSFSRDSKLVGVGCYDQNEFIELYKLKDDETLDFVADFFVEGEPFSSDLYFHPFKDEFAISYPQKLMYYSYEGTRLEKLWENDITYLHKPHCNGYVDYINENTLIFGYGSTIEIRNCRSSVVINNFYIEDKIIMGLLFIKSTEKILVATNKGFVLLDLNQSNLVVNRKPWWKIW